MNRATYVLTLALVSILVFVVTFWISYNRAYKETRDFFDRRRK